MFISVHTTDHCRLDLIIPSEQHFYVRAATSQERQQWLVALGSAKASKKIIGRNHEETPINRGSHDKKNIQCWIKLVWGL